jgi:hypothetical protein
MTHLPVIDETYFLPELDDFVGHADWSLRPSEQEQIIATSLCFPVIDETYFLPELDDYLGHTHKIEIGRYYWTVADSGGGVDALALGGIAVLQSDVGYGLDLLVLVVDLAQADAGAGSELAALCFALADAGAGSELAALCFALADAGAGSERITDRAIGLLDLGHAVEFLISPCSLLLYDSGLAREQLALSLALVDSGAGVDLAALWKFLEDSGAGSDALALAVLIPSPDAGAGSDEMLALVVVTSATDSGYGFDAVTLPAVLSLFDSGLGADVVSNLWRKLLDSGAGQETVVIMPGVQDAGQGADAVLVAAGLNLEDGGAGDDTIQQTAELVIEDAGAGLDALALAVAHLLTDSGAGGEAISLANLLLLLDAGLGSDVISALSRQLFDVGLGLDAVVIMPRLTDTGQGTEVVSAAAELDLFDSATGQDLLLPIVVFIQDTGAGLEAVQQAAALLVQDAGTGLEDLALSVALHLVESGAGQEVLSLSNLLALLDSGAGSEHMALVILLFDAGVGLDVWTVPFISVGLSAGQRAWALRAPTRAFTVVAPDRNQTERVG